MDQFVVDIYERDATPEGEQVFASKPDDDYFDVFSSRLVFLCFQHDKHTDIFCFNTTSHPDSLRLPHEL